MKGRKQEEGRKEAKKKDEEMKKRRKKEVEMKERWKDIKHERRRNEWKKKDRKEGINGESGVKLRLLKWSVTAIYMARQPAEPQDKPNQVQGHNTRVRPRFQPLSLTQARIPGASLSAFR
jgi:hypothetical protein